MSVHISARAWLVQGLTFAEKLVLLKLADMANDEGVCWPATATLGDQCGLDRRSVRRILARLEAAGHVHRKARFNEKGLNTSNWLTVLPPADRRAAVDPLPCRSAAADGGKGDRSVLPVEGDRSVLPPRTGRSSLGGTGRSSKPSLETSMKQAGRSDGSTGPHQSRRSPRECGGAMRPAVRRHGDASASNDGPAKPRPSYAEILEHRAAMVRGSTFGLGSLITPRMGRDMVAAGLVTASELRERGVTWAA